MTTVTEGWASLKALRSANAIVRALGGTAIKLRICTGLADADTRGLGLSPAQFEDIEVNPAVLQSQDDGTLLVLIPADSIQYGENDGCQSARTLLPKAVAILHGERLLKIKSIRASYAGGLEYLYQITVTE